MFQGLCEELFKLTYEVELLLVKFARLEGLTRVLSLIHPFEKIQAGFVWRSVAAAVSLVVRWGLAPF